MQGNSFAQRREPKIEVGGFPMTGKSEHNRALPDLLVIRSPS